MVAFSIALHTKRSSEMQRRWETHVFSTARMHQLNFPCHDGFPEAELALLPPTHNILSSQNHQEEKEINRMQMTGEDEEASESWKTSNMASLSEAASASQAGYTCRHLPQHPFNQPTKIQTKPHQTLRISSLLFLIHMHSVGVSRSVNPFLVLWTGRLRFNIPVRHYRMGDMAFTDTTAIATGTNQETQKGKQPKKQTRHEQDAGEKNAEGGGEAARHRSHGRRATRRALAEAEPASAS